MILSCCISDSHSGKSEGCGLLGCNALKPSRSPLMSRRNELPVPKSKPQQDAGSNQSEPPAEKQVRLGQVKCIRM
jgi:hypothetical protein